MFGYWLLMRLLFHVFDVRSLHKSFLQTPPDFTDRIFRWTIHHSELLRFQKELFACLFCRLFSYWFLFSIACAWILIYLFLYLVSFLSHVLNVFCFIPFIFCILFFLYRLSMNVSFSLVYFSSGQCFRYSGLYFVLFLGLNNYLSLYWLLAFLFHYFFIYLMLFFT